MKISGITAEYNPLHKGHVYQMQQARVLSGCDVLVVAMSGDFVQRGEPALLDKWTRCSLALESGADLVVEIPVQFCLGNASQYASASVKILESLGCSSIVFGSESGDAGLLKDVAGSLNAGSEKLEAAASELARTGMSYPAARAEAYKAMRIGIGEERLARELGALSDPNDILAIEYIRNMKSAEPLCVRRVSAGHGAGFDSSLEFQSAGAIRKLLGAGNDPETAAPYVPECTLRALCEEILTFPDDWSDLLRYAVLMTPAEIIEDCPSAGEGLGNLLKQIAYMSGGWEDLIKAVKSKRYTYTRISRLCMQLILGITRSGCAADSPAYARVLGFSDRGRQLLAGLRKTEGEGLPVITNINKEAGSLSESAAEMLALDVKAADVYNLITGRGAEHSDHLKMPVMK